LGRRAIGLAAAMILGVTAVASGQEVAPAGDGLLICYPNAPGSPEAASSLMEQLGAYLSERSGQAVAPVYFNEVAPARAWLEEAEPRFGILSLALYLRWREELGLVVLARSERSGRTSERFHVLVPAGSPHQALEDLGRERLGRPGAIWSTHLDDARFASRVVFGGRLEASADGEADVRTVSTHQPLRVLRRLKRGDDFQGQPVDAVVVDDTFWERLQDLRTFSGDLRVLERTAALPTPPVVAFAGAGAAARADMAAAFTGMDADPAGRELMEAMQVTGFRAPAEEALDAVIEAYERGVE